MRVATIVPVYNEHPNRLKKILSDLANYVDHIIVVDDGSDQPIETIIQATLPKVDVLRHKINRGQGAALQTGTNWAIQQAADIIVHFDGDGQHTPADIPEIIQPIIKGGADYVFGSRFLGKSSNIPWFKKYIILPISRIINYIYSGLKLTDVHTGIRAFNKKIHKQIYLSHDQMAHNSEYSYLVKKNNIKYAEVPVKISYHEFGQGIGGGFKILKELITGKIIKKL